MKRPTDTTIGITGGIGSGKSVVARILSTMGYTVYDCDSRARALMDSDDNIKERISAEISADVIIDGEINRQMLGEIVFNDRKALNTLNSIVHTAVKDDFLKYRNTKKGVVFVESAILLQSCFYSVVDAAWVVIAPEELRISRVMKRNSLTRSQVEARIASQDAAPVLGKPDCMVTIINDDATSLLQQVTNLLQIP